MRKYIKYRFQNIEPLRITDDSRSQSGQMATLRYIPGSTVRGYIISQMASKTEFNQNKVLLFSDKISFLNAYPITEGKEMIPSPKGFYEDKTKSEGKKAIVNVVATGNFDDGMKRAGLGRFCYFEDNCINYANIETDDDMKIKINLADNEKNNVFRNEYIRAGYLFEGYIGLDDDIQESLIKEICQMLSGIVILGNARTQGLGKCRFDNCEITEDIPYKSYYFKGTASGGCYMMFVSHGTMRGNNGEYCGLNLKDLEQVMGVNNLNIATASTSVVEVRGYNRTLGGKLPSVPMYEQGSVFKLSFDGELSEDKMLQISNSGIGIRRNEGFGRVIFLKDYEAIKDKLETRIVLNKNGQVDSVNGDMTLKIVAKNYYTRVIKDAMIQKIVDTEPFGGFANKEIGKIESLITANRYNPSELKTTLDKYFAHEKEKEDKSKVHKVKKSIMNIMNIVNGVWDNEIEQIWTLGNSDKIMGFSKKELLSPEEIDRLKIEYLIKAMRYKNRKGNN